MSAKNWKFSVLLHTTQQLMTIDRRSIHSLSISIEKQKIYKKKNKSTCKVVQSKQTHRHASTFQLMHDMFAHNLRFSSMYLLFSYKLCSIDIWTHSTWQTVQPKRLKRIRNGFPIRHCVCVTYVDDGTILSNCSNEHSFGTRIVRRRLIIHVIDNANN